MDDLVSKLSEIRSKYNCFDEDEGPYYRALSDVIKILSRLADGDAISRQQAIDEFNCCELTPDGGIDANHAIDVLKQLPSAQQEITEEAVKEYCRKRNLCIIDSELLKKYTYEVVVLTIFGPFLCKN